MVDIGHDPGYGYNKSAVDIDGNISYEKDNSVVAWSAEASVGAIKFEGKYWHVGKAALLRKNQVEITNHDILEQYQPLFLLHMLKKLGIDPDSVGIIATGLSLAHESRAESFKNRLTSFEANDRMYHFNIEIVAQAVGAKYVIDDFDERPENYAIFDIGSNTLDALVVIDGEIQEGSRFGTDNRGVFTVARTLQQHLVDIGVGSVSLPESMKILETGSIKLYGVEHDLANAVEEIKSKYTNELMSYIDSRWNSELRILDSIIFVGGGSHFLDENLMQPHFMIPSNPEYFNAVGNLRSVERTRISAKAKVMA
jgi:hypothetical protein